MLVCGVGDIAPDCNLPNEDGTDFIPPRKVTHWMQGARKSANDTGRFFEEYCGFLDRAVENVVKAVSETVEKYLT